MTLYRARKPLAQFNFLEIKYEISDGDGTSFYITLPNANHPYLIRGNDRRNSLCPYHKGDHVGEFS